MPPRSAGHTRIRHHGRIPFRQMRKQQSHQHLDGQRGRDKSSEQTDDQAAAPTDSRVMTTYVHNNAGSMPFLENTSAASASAPSLNFVETCIKKITPTTMRAKLRRLAASSRKPGESRVQQFCFSLSHDTLPIYFLDPRDRCHQLTTPTVARTKAITAGISEH
jgi:hypothetical protein